jgi:hypothetical protein
MWLHNRSLSRSKREARGENSHEDQFEGYPKNNSSRGAGGLRDPIARHGQDTG